MKNFKVLALAALALNLFAVSCKSDDDNNTNNSNNVMTIDGQQFEIEVGILSEFGVNPDGSYDWDVVFLSSEFDINISQQNVSGTGSTMYLDLNTNSADGLVAGTYTYAQDRGEFTWVFADAATNFNADTEDGDFFDAVSGTVTITGSGNNQKIVVNLVDQSGNPITASYTGALVLD